MHRSKGVQRGRCFGELGSGWHDADGDSGTILEWSRLSWDSSYQLQERLSDLIGPYWGTYGIVKRAIQPLLAQLKFGTTSCSPQTIGIRQRFRWTRQSSTTQRLRSWAAQADRRHQELLYQGAAGEETCQARRWSGLDQGTAGVEWVSAKKGRSPSNKR